jgi:hypothetical protein
MVFAQHSGRWDMTFAWQLTGGPSDLAWEFSPDDVKWLKALAEQEGGKEKADKIWKEYLSLVSDSETELVRSVTLGAK